MLCILPPCASMHIHVSDEVCIIPSYTYRMQSYDIWVCTSYEYAHTRILWIMHHTRVVWSHMTYEYVHHTSIHIHVSDDVCIFATLCEYVHTRTPWLYRSLKVQVSFSKRATNYKALPRKKTYKDKATYPSSPPVRILGLYRSKGRGPVLHTQTHIHTYKHTYMSHVYVCVCLFVCVYVCLCM